MMLYHSYRWNCLVPLWQFIIQFSVTIGLSRAKFVSLPDFPCFFRTCSRVGNGLFNFIPNPFPVSFPTLTWRLSCWTVGCFEKFLRKSKLKIVPLKQVGKNPGIPVTQCVNEFTAMSINRFSIEHRPLQKFVISSILSFKLNQFGIVR